MELIKSIGGRSREVGFLGFFFFNKEAERRGSSRGVGHEKTPRIGDDTQECGTGDDT